MADRLTQLQEAVNQLAEYFCNSVGVLQQDSGSTQGGEESQEGAGASGTGTGSDSSVALFSSLITRTAQDIEILVDSLPDHEVSSERQGVALRRLEQENQQCAEQLAKVTAEAEVLLGRVREAIKYISDTQLGLRRDGPPKKL